MPLRIKESPKKGKSPVSEGKSPVSAGATADCIFHQDIMLCILKRLPVKSILRFKSVCKPWLDLFSTRDFVKMHKNHFSIHPSVIIQSGPDGRTMFLLNIESDEKKPTILDHPRPGSTYPMDILGCCNGLICMGRAGFVLWNPAMKSFKFVPPSENVAFTDPEDLSLGFGYDAEGDDFKVVILRYFDARGVEVYSVNADSWITIDPGFQFSVVHKTNNVIVNGNPYWVADVDGIHSLVWFDVRRMVFKVVPLATDDFHVPEMAHVLVDWEGSLGVLVSNREREGVECFDIWVFDDGAQIWRKDHSVGPIVGLDVSWYLPLSSNNGKVIGLCPPDNLFVYDPNTKRAKVFDVQPWHRRISPCIYAESLTCIKGMRPVQLKRGGRGRRSILGIKLSSLWTFGPFAKDIVCFCIFNGFSYGTV
ncbi:hypothetical protein OROMI_003111 [Orobanche minor]